MFRSRRVWQAALTTGIMSGVMLFPILSVVEKEGMEGIRGYFIAGISYLLNENNFELYPFFRNTWILGFVLMIITAGIVCIVRRNKSVEWLLGIIILIEIILGLTVSSHYTYKVNRTSFVDLAIAEKISENSSDKTRVTYLDEGSPEFIDFQQMQLPDIPIRVIKGEVSEQMDELGDFLIVFYDTKQKEKLERIYDRYLKTNTFILYFNQAD